MRRHKLGALAPDHGARLDGVKGIDAGLEIGAGASPAAEVVVELFGLVVCRVIVAALGVRLPNLKQNIGGLR